jgi:hypothetical protein
MCILPQPNQYEISQGYLNASQDARARTLSLKYTHTHTGTIKRSMTNIKVPRKTNTVHQRVAPEAQEPIQVKQAQAEAETQTKHRVKGKDSDPSIRAPPRTHGHCARRCAHKSAVGTTLLHRQTPHTASHTAPPLLLSITKPKPGTAAAILLPVDLRPRTRHASVSACRRSKLAQHTCLRWVRCRCTHLPKLCWCTPGIRPPVAIRCVYAQAHGRVHECIKGGGAHAMATAEQACRDSQDQATIAGSCSRAPSACAYPYPPHCRSVLRILSLLLQQQQQQPFSGRALIVEKGQRPQGSSAGRQRPVDGRLLPSMRAAAAEHSIPVPPCICTCRHPVSLGGRDHAK